MSTLGARIRKARKKINLTIEQLSEKVGVSKNYMGDLERDKCFPSFSVLISLAKALNVSPDYLCQDYLGVAKSGDLEQAFSLDYSIAKVANLMLEMNAKQKEIVLQTVLSLKEFNQS